MWVVICILVGVAIDEGIRLSVTVRNRHNMGQNWRGHFRGYDR